MIQAKITYMVQLINETRPPIFSPATGKQIMLILTDSEGKDYYILSGAPDSMPDLFKNSTLPYRIAPFLNSADEGVEANITDYCQIGNEQIVIDLQLVGVKEER